MNEKKLCDVLEKALNLEHEGRLFYLSCKDATDDEAGKELFQYLADEEVTHFKKVVTIFKKHLNKGYCDWEARVKPIKSGIFETNFPGGKLTDETDSLEALNIGIRAEENSIKHYKWLAENAEDDDISHSFNVILEEEQKHKSILMQEMESLTQTGEYFDFKQVSS